MEGNTSQDGARPALFQNCCVVVRIVCFVLFYVLFVCKCVLPPGDNPIAVNKYIISKMGMTHLKTCGTFFLITISNPTKDKKCSCLFVDLDYLAVDLVGNNVHNNP